MEVLKKLIRLFITLFLIVGIGVLSYMLYQGLNKDGINTNISSVEQIPNRDTPEVKETQTTSNTDTTLPPYIPNVEQPSSNSNSENNGNQQSIIVDKPIRREQTDISSSNTGGDDRIQSSVMHEDGDILEVLEVFQITEDVEDDESLLELALKLKHEKELRNQGRMIAGMEVALFVDFNGNKLETSNILSKPIVVVAWKSDEVDYVTTLNKLYSEYKDKLYIIFLSRNSDDKDVIEGLIKNNNFSFKCYYDASAGFAGYTGLSSNTEVLFINKDDYIVSRLIGKTTEKELREQFDALTE